MANKCWNLNQIRPGVEVFADKFRATGDFLQSSLLAVKYLNDQGIKIPKTDFDLIVRDNFGDIVTRQGNSNFLETKKVSQLTHSINRLLGVVNGTRAKRGKYNSGTMSIEAQDKLDRISKGVLHNELDGLSNGERIIVEGIKEGKTYGDPHLLEDMLSSLKEIKANGEAQLEKMVAEQKQAEEEITSALAKDFSILSSDYYDIREYANNLYHNNIGDTQTLVDMLDDKLSRKVRVENFGNDPKKVAVAVIEQLQNVVDASMGTKLLHDMKKKYGILANNTIRNLNTVVSIASKGSENLADQLIVDPIRQAGYDISEHSEAYINNLGKIIEKVSGMKKKTFKGNKASVRQAEHYVDIVKEYALQTAYDIETGIVLPNGRVWTTNKGELMQLYADAMDPDIAKSMELAGVSLQQLDKLVSEHLSEVDKRFVLETASFFYEDMWIKENEVYERMYHTRMPKNKNYAGPIRYQLDSKEAPKLTADNLVNRKKVNTMLGNAIERQSNDNPLDLHRHFLANAITRANNSAKFIGGAEAYTTYEATFKRQEVRDSLNESNYTDMYKEINKRIDVAMGFDSYGEGIALINALKGNMVQVSLALKPKLALNQVASMINWLNEDATIKGIGKRHPDLQGVNISKMIIEASPWVRNRYKNKNIIALEAQIEASTGSVEAMLGLDTKGGKNISRLRKGWLSTRVGFSKFLTIFTTVGDGAGIMWMGVQYFKGRYAELRAQGMNHEAAVKKAAFDFAKTASKGGQQSYDSIDRAPIQQHPVGSMFVMYKTSPIQLHNATIAPLVDLYRHATGKEHKNTVGKNVRQIFIMHYVSGFMYHYIMNGLPMLLMSFTDGIPDNEWCSFKKGVGNAAVEGAWGPGANSIFLIADILGSIKSLLAGNDFGENVGSSPAFQLVNKALKAVKKYIKLVNKDNLTPAEEEKMDELWIDIFKAFTELYGVPVKRFNEMYDGLKAIISGEGTPEQWLQLAGWSKFTQEQNRPCGWEENSGDESSFWDDGGENSFWDSDNESNSFWNDDSTNSFWD